MRRAIAIVVLALVAACGGCAKRAEKPLSEKGEKLYDLRGKIISRDAGENSLRIDHEAIPGFMEAMAMDYVVRGAKVGALPPDNTRVTAKLHVTDDNYWVTDVRAIP